MCGNIITLKNVINAIELYKQPSNSQKDGNKNVLYMYILLTVMEVCVRKKRRKPYSCVTTGNFKEGKRS